VRYIATHFSRLISTDSDSFCDGVPLNSQFVHQLLEISAADLGHNLDSIPELSPDLTRFIFHPHKLIHMLSKSSLWRRLFKRGC
jgi:hypothetical protein